MSFMQRLWLRVGPTMETIELGSPSSTGSPNGPDVAGDGKLARDETVASAATLQTGRGSPEWSAVTRWFLNDIFYIAMLLLALAGVILRLPVTYWIILTPVFGLISIVEGWSHFTTRGEQLGLACRVAAIWGALLMAIYLLYNNGVSGVLNANGTSLAMLTLLALGTFVAGVQARVWQICAVGGLLFLAVPGVGWVDQSPLLLAVATIFAIAVGGLVWWVRQLQTSPKGGPVPTETTPTDVSRGK